MLYDKLMTLSIEWNTISRKPFLIKIKTAIFHMYSLYIWISNVLYAAIQRGRSKWFESSSYVVSSISVGIHLVFPLCCAQMLRQYEFFLKCWNDIDALYCWREFNVIHSELENGLFVSTKTLWNGKISHCLSVRVHIAHGNSCNCYGHLPICQSVCWTKHQNI